MNGPENVRIHGSALNRVDALLELLDQMWVQHRHIARLLQRQREALIARNLAVLDDVNGELARAADVVRALEAARMEETAALAWAVGLPVETVTARWLADLLDERRAERLRQVASGLATELERVRGLQQGNAALAERGLRYVAETVRLLAKAVETGYQRPGASSGNGSQVAGGIWFDGRA